ncbi:hypothetical protein [Massilia sp. DD77]|uniref:hypothetical protein n=1 Tax=Massilia sp. DD77 TaxID=3109349 RepID=UPI00300012E9
MEMVVVTGRSLCERGAGGVEQYGNDRCECPEETNQQLSPFLIVLLFPPADRLLETVLAQGANVYLKFTPMLKKPRAS